MTSPTPHELASLTSSGRSATSRIKSTVFGRLIATPSVSACSSAGLPANEAAVARGIEPSARLAGRDDRHRLLDRQLMLATRTAPAAATVPPSIPSVLSELSAAPAPAAAPAPSAVLTAAILTIRS